MAYLDGVKLPDDDSRDVYGEFNKYYFVYRDITGRWNEARNPVFIAEHKECRAIKKEGYKNINELLNELNKG